jgi:hypothetical protein
MLWDHAAASEGVAESGRVECGRCWDQMLEGRCGLGGRLVCGVSGFARDAIFATEQSSCTAIPCSSITQDSRETARPQIQQVRGSFEAANIFASSA